MRSIYEQMDQDLDHNLVYNPVLGYVTDGSEIILYIIIYVLISSPHHSGFRSGDVKERNMEPPG